MNKLPWVSIVTPSYNQAQFLEATIRSVVEQEYPRLEYMICDGGSTDGSADLIQSYASRLTWWCSEKDGGQSAAVNKGWQRARGELVAYLNSDDVLQPGAVAAVVQAWRAQPEVGILHGDWLYLDAAGSVIGAAHGAPADARKLLRDGQIRYVAQPASFYRANLVCALGGLNQALAVAMDYDLLVRLALQAPMLYVPRVLAGFRIHSTSKSSALAEKHWRESFAVVRQYGPEYKARARLRYARYLVLRAAPPPLQHLFRRLRASPADRVLLRTQTPSPFEPQ